MDCDLVNLYRHGCVFSSPRNHFTSFRRVEVKVSIYRWSRVHRHIRDIVSQQWRVGRLEVIAILPGQGKRAEVNILGRNMRKNY